VEGNTIACEGFCVDIRLTNRPTGELFDSRLKLFEFI
jgi:hypothetical protein